MHKRSCTPRPCPGQSLYRRSHQHHRQKAHLLALYRQHGEYSRREVASRVAGELAEAAGLQPGTARAYVYEELAHLAGDSDRAGTHRQAGLLMDPAASKEDHQ